MASILVPYATGEGQTAKVAERIVEVLDERGHAATAVNVAEMAADLAVDDYDAVLVGASIHLGKHQQSVRQFVQDHRDVLAARPTGFFQVSMSSAQDTDESAAEAAAYVDEFVETTGWRPDRIGLFGGALRFSQYGFFARALMKRIGRRAFPEADTSGDVEFTDWEEVEAFAEAFGAFVEERLGETAEPSKAGD